MARKTGRLDFQRATIFYIFGWAYYSYSTCTNLEHQLWEWSKKFQMTGRLVCSDLLQKGSTKGEIQKSQMTCRRDFVR
jgi:hypothetical protein